MRSAIYTSLETVRPIAIGSSIVLFRNLSLSNTERIDTVCGSLLGTSIPIVPLPGIGAMIRIPKAARLSAISSSRFLILAILTPSAGIISYRVTVGPTVAFILEMAMP